MRLHAFQGCGMCGPDWSLEVGDTALRCARMVDAWADQHGKWRSLAGMYVVDVSHGVGTSPHSCRRYQILDQARETRRLCHGQLRSCMRGHLP